MNNLFKFSALCVIAATALVSCSKETEIVTPSSQDGVVLTFKSEKPDIIDPETKTVWNADEKTIFWSTTDKIRIALKVGENWQNANGDATSSAPAKLYESKQAGSEAKVADFTVPTDFKVATEGSYQFYAIYPSSICGLDAKYIPSLTVTVPTDQTPSAYSFDPSADVMVAAATETYTELPTTAIPLLWNRVVAHGDITLKNLPSLEEGEMITSIQLAAQEGAQVTGYHYLDLVEGVFTLPDNASPVNYVNVEASNLSLNTDGNLEFWFASLPFTATELTVTIKTNKYEYVKTYSGISKEFKVNTRNILGISMKNAAKMQNYEESFHSGEGDFSASGVWTPGNYNGIYYMKANNKDATGDWLISPSLSILSNSSVLSFSQAINKNFVTIEDEASVWVREGTDGEWTKLAITYPETPTSTWSSFEETTVSLSGYNGKTVQVGFKYVGAESGGYANGWEVANFKVTYAEPLYTPSLIFATTSATIAAAGGNAEFAYTAKHAEPTVAVKTDTDGIIDGTPTIADGKVIAVVKANTEAKEKTATLVVSCSGLEDIELVINQDAKSNEVEKTTMIDFTAQGYENQQDVTSLTVEPITVTLAKGTGSNAAKYYTSGTAVRCYAGNTITLSSDKKIVKVVFSFGSSDGSNAITADVGSFSSPTWTGSTNAVTFTIGGTSGNRRIQKIGVTYLDAPDTTPRITLSNLPSTNVAAAGDVVTINYEITNPVEGVSVSASAGDNAWVNTFDFTEAGSISFVVDANTAETERTATITVSYQGAEDETFEITQNAAPNGATTVTATISNQDWTNGVQYLNLSIDENITATINGSSLSNSGKYYDSGSDWRLYQTENPTLSISAATGYTIKSIKVTFNNSNGGTLIYNGSSVSSASTVAVDAQSADFTIGNSGSATNGQVRIKDITVSYK